MFALAPFPKDNSSTQASSATGNNSVIPHILPCRIHRDGPVKVSRRYWDPTVENGDGARMIFFLIFAGEKKKAKKSFSTAGKETNYLSLHQRKKRQAQA